MDHLDLWSPAMGKCRKIKFKSNSGLSKYCIKKIDKLTSVRTNYTRHSDINIKTIKQETVTHYKKFHTRSSLPLQIL